MILSHEKTRIYDVLATNVLVMVVKKNSGLIGGGGIWSGGWGPHPHIAVKQIEVLPLGTNWRSVQAAETKRNCGFRRFNGRLYNLKLFAARHS